MSLKKCSQCCEIPNDVLEVSYAFLSHNQEYEADLLEMLSSSKMIGFWLKLRKIFDKSPVLPITPKGIEHNWRGLIKNIVMLMAFKGGKLPDISNKELIRKRKGDSKGTGTAKSIRTLKKALGFDENVGNLKLVDLIQLCASSSDNEIAERGEAVKNVLENQLPYLCLTSPTLIQILSAIEEKASSEIFEPLSRLDARPVGYIPST